MQTREASLGVSAGDGEEGLEGVGGGRRRSVDGWGVRRRYDGFVKLIFQHKLDSVYYRSISSSGLIFLEGDDVHREQFAQILHPIINQLGEKLPALARPAASLSLPFSTP